MSGIVHLLFYLTKRVFFFYCLGALDFGPRGTIGRLAQATPKRFYVIGLLSKFCDSCRSGAILRWLQDLQVKYHKQVGVLCLLPPSFNGHDLEVLASQANISFPIVVGHGDLAESWATLSRRYGGVDSTDVVLICDKEGRVLDGGTVRCGPCFNRITELINRGAS